MTVLQLENVSVVEDIEEVEVTVIVLVSVYALAPATEKWSITICPHSSPPITV